MNKITAFLRKPIVGTLIAILMGFLFAALVLLLAGYNPGEAIYAMLSGIVGRPKYIANIIVKSTPIILTGCSVAFAYKMGLFNIGAEGQYIIGALAACITGILCNFTPWIQIPLILLAGMAAGALYGAFSGWLKARFHIHEVISGIMLNWIALYFSNYVINLKLFHKPDTSGTYPIHPSGFTTFLTNWKSTPAAAEFMRAHPYLGDILRTDFNAGIFIAILLVLASSYILFRTSKGYQLRAVGNNKDAAEFAGINVRKNIIQTMLIAGGLAGISGALSIAGNTPHAVLQLASFEGNGLNGLSVAFIANGSPIGCIFSGLLFGALIYGGQSIQYMVGAPSEIINIMIGTIVFFVALKDVVLIVADYLDHRQLAKQQIQKTPNSSGDSTQKKGEILL